MAWKRIRAIACRKACASLATFVVFALGACWSGWAPGDSASAREGRSTAGGYPPPSSVVALARLLPASGLISVGTRPGLRVAELKIKEDDQVPAGAALAILEGHESARFQLALARAQKRRAEYDREMRLAAARKAADVTKRRLDQGRGLYNQFGAALKGKDRYDAEMALYQVEMQAIKTELELDLARGAPAPADSKAPAAANAEDTILEAQVELAEAGLRETEVRAPGPGRVLRILTHAGELGAGALLLMGDVSSMVAKAEVYQSDVPRIRVGDPAEVDILGTRISGKVTRIGSVVGKNQLMSVDPRAMRDLRVVEVTIQLDQPAPADRFVDMEVEAVIRPSGSAGGPAGTARPASTRGPG